MPGRRDHGGESAFPFGEQLKTEFRGLLALLLKNTAMHRLPLLEASSGWTSYQFDDFHVDVIDVSIQPAPVGVSPNAVLFSAASSPVKQLPLLTADAVGLHTGMHLPEVPLRLMTPLTVENCALQTMVPEPFATQLPANADFSLTPLVAAKGTKAAKGASEKEETHSWEIPTSTTRANPIGTRLVKPTQTHNTPVLGGRTPFQSGTARMNRMPVRKKPVPLHRFSLAMRQRFRQALSEKSGAPFDQIQLLLVYDRLDMTLYGSILKDEQGDLICTPKSAAPVVEKKHATPPRGIERWRERPQSEASEPSRLVMPDSLRNVYLILGLRLDTQQEIRALIPMADWIDPASDPSGGEAP
jgi:hypothetical protein